jgi:head-tail adaptor
MPNCARIKPKPYKICTGDLRYQITIQQRTKLSNNLGNAEPNIKLTTIKTIYALQKSVNGEEIFNDSNLVIGKITDEFYVRYQELSGITKTNIISSNGNFYVIQNIIPDLQGRRQFGVLRCSFKGPNTLQVNELE